MDNLHRELAPISDAAWAQIEDEARAKRLIDQIGVSSISTAPVERTRRRDLTHGWTTAPANAPPETAATA